MCTELLVPLPQSLLIEDPDEDLMVIKRKCLDFCLFKLFLRVMN